MSHGAAAALQVLSIDGAARPRRVGLESDSLAIGRDASNDLVLSDPAVSRQHLRISRHGSVWHVQRLPQAQPLYLNGSQRDTADLQVGDQLVIGGTVLRFELPTAAMPGTSAPDGHAKTVLGSAPVPTLLVTFPGGQFEAPLRADTITLGRAPESGIVVPSPIVGAHHAILRRGAGGYVIEDQGSLNGLTYQHAQIASHTLQSGDVITIGSRVDGQVVTLTYTAPRLRATAGPVSVPLGSGPVTLGRDAHSTFPLPNPQVSWHHAQLAREASGALVLSDLGSTNGTYVNYQQVKQPRRLMAGDQVNIGPFAFRFDGLQLNPMHSAGTGASGMRVDALDLVRTVQRGRKVLLDRVTLSVLPGEFLGIVGGNGAGKSTLLKALVGLEPAQEGAVLFDGIDSYQHASVLRGSIGYVPQADIVHGALTVERALYYAARLRLARDISEEEIQQRIGTVLDAMDLSEHRHKVIGSQLSGGQRKRVSIAVELLAAPPILFLDEPEAALDPLSWVEVFGLLRHLADRGQTIVLVTHRPENKIDICDRVAVMGYGGRLCYLGPPAAAPGFFGASDFVSIYGQIEEDSAAQRWRAQFEGSALYQREVDTHLRQVVVPAGTLSLPASARQGWNPRDAARRYASVGQLGLLSRRYADIFVRDWRNVAILFLQAPLIALVLAVLSNAQTFVSATGPFQAQKILFFLAIVAIWFGTINAVREICKESDIYRRERLAGLGIAPYIASKVGILGLLCLIQTAILLLIVGAKTGLPPAGAGLFFPPALELYFGVALAGLAGLALGLCVSALAGNPDRAVAFVPLVLLPQILLGGVIFQLSGPTQTVADLMISRWAVQSLGTSADLDHLYYTQQASIAQAVAAGGVLSGTPPPFTPSDYDRSPRAGNYTPSVAAGASWADAPASREAQLLLTWGVLALLAAVFLCLAGWRLRSRDPT